MKNLETILGAAFLVLVGIVLMDDKPQRIIDEAEALQREAKAHTIGWNDGWEAAVRVMRSGRMTIVCPTGSGKTSIASELMRESEE